MTPFTATPAFEHFETARAVQAATGQLVPASLSDTAPWLYSALSQLHDLEQVGRNVPGVGNLQVADRASQQFKAVLVLIDVKGTLPTPALFPISGGGIGMKWALGNREVEFTTFPNGNTIVSKLENSELVDDWELAGTPHENAQLNSYLGWLVAAR